MSVEVTTLAILAVLILGFVVYLARGWDRKPERRQVIVPLRTGDTLRGVLLARRPGYLELGQVEVLTGERVSTVDGRVQIDRDNVLWVQVL